MRVVRSCFCFELFLFAALCLFGGTSAYGQAGVNLPPLADSASPTGVSFKSGAFTIDGIVDLSIGGGGIAGLQLIRNYYSSASPVIADNTGAQGWSYNTVAQISRVKYVYPPDQEPPPNPNSIPFVYTVTTGPRSFSFMAGSTNVPPATSYTLNHQGSEKLTFTQVGTGLPASGSYFTFTDSGGSVYVYPYNGQTRLGSVTYPDGTRWDFTYVIAPSSNRVTKSIFSNRGYAILFDGATKACVVNLAETYVTTTSTCPVGAQAVTYSYTASTFNPFISNLTGSTDAIGQTTTYGYVGADHLGCVKLPGQSTCTISNTYNVCTPPPGGGSPPANLRYSDRVTSQVTGTGESYTYSYGYFGAYEYCNDYTGYGAATTMVAPGSATTVVGTNGVGAVTAITDPLGRFSGTSYYDGSGGEAESADFYMSSAHEGNAIYVVRDARGNITQTWRKAKTGTGVADMQIGTASHPATCTNPKTCNKPDYVIDARGNRTDFTWDSAHGGMTSVTLPAAASGGIRPQRRFAYTQLYAWIKNSSGSFVQAATPVWMLTGISECRSLSSCAGGSDEIKTTITYGTTGVANNLLPTSISIGPGSTAPISTIATTYDTVGNVLTVDGPQSGSADTTRYRYDTLRRVIGVVGPDPDGANPLKHRAVRNTFNAAGRLVMFERGTVNSQTDADWTAFVSLENVQMGYDLLGRITSASTSGGTTTSAVTHYSYDASGRRDCVAVRMDPLQWNTQTNACLPQASGGFGPDRITRNFYNAAGDLVRVRVAAGIGGTVEGDEKTLTYSSNGRVATVVDGQANTTTLSYDAFDRSFKTTYADSSYEQLWFDANDNVEKLRRRDAQEITLTYDNLNRVKLKNLPGSETDISYSSYDLQGNLLQLVGGSTIGFTYDSLGRKTRETIYLGNFDYEYDSASRRTKATWPDGFYVNYDYFVTSEVKAIRENGATAGIGLLANYSYDDRGNRVRIDRGNDADTVVIPDFISRLGSLTHDLSGSAQDITTTLTYNPANQIATYTRDNDAYAWAGHYNLNRTDTVNNLNQVATFGGGSVVHDGRGNVTSFDGKSFSYSSENRLTSITGIGTLLYDAAGRLSENTAGGSKRFLYDGLDVVAEYDSSNVLQRRYVHGPGSDELLVWYEGSAPGIRRWVHQDERGSVVALTNDSGVRTAVNSYDEYGVPSAANVGRFGYTGQMWIPEIGLYYYKARMYSPKFGRFMQTDPIGYAGGMNLYGYVDGDPANLTDPSGLESDGDRPNLERGNRFAYFRGGFREYAPYDYLHRVESTYKQIEAINLMQSQCRRYPYLADAGGIERICFSATNCQYTGREAGLGKTAEDLFYTFVSPGSRTVKMTERVGAGAAIVAKATASIGTKIEKQLAKRGWSRQGVEDALANPTRTVATRDTRHLPGGGRMDDPAIAYYGKDGGYVVRNERTGDIVQISDRMDSGWVAPWD